MCFLNFNEGFSRQGESGAEHSPRPHGRGEGLGRPLPACVGLVRSGTSERQEGRCPRPRMRRLGEKREKNKNKRCLCLEKVLGSAPDLDSFWKQAVMLLRRATRQAARYLRGQRESQAPEESVSKLAPANENQEQGSGNLWQEGNMLWAPRARVTGGTERGRALSEEPPDPEGRNGCLSTPTSCCLLG